MIHKKFSRNQLLAGAGVLVVAAGVLYGCSSGGGHSAADTDTSYISSLKAQGATVVSTTDAIKLAHSICDAFGQGSEMAAINDALVGQATLSPFQANIYIHTGVDSYCPQYADKVQQ